MACSRIKIQTQKIKIPSGTRGVVTESFKIDKDYENVTSIVVYALTGSTTAKKLRIGFNSETKGTLEDSAPVQHWMRDNANVDSFPVTWKNNKEDFVINLSASEQTTEECELDVVFLLKNNDKSEDCKCKN